MLSWVFPIWYRRMCLALQGLGFNINKQRSKGYHRNPMMSNTNSNIESGSNKVSMEQDKSSTSESNGQQDDEMSRIAMLQAKEEEIEKRKMAVKERVELQLGRVEEETRKLVRVWEEIQVMEDPMKKEVAMLRKKVDLANRDVKALAQSSQKKEKEYREALEAFNEKSKEKSGLVATLKELLARSESLRMKKLEELSKFIEPTN
ncbi:hypothetical protein LINGRAHAP2_LOCUS20957 [Linum grandiflorum]